MTMARGELRVELDYDTVMMQRAGTEPAMAMHHCHRRDTTVCGDPGPDSLALSVNHLWEHEVDLRGIQLPFDDDSRRGYVVFSSPSGATQGVA